MQHIFDVEIAEKYGVLEAVLIKHFQYWIKKNEANGVNYYDGSYWTYNSIKAFKEIFPYASERQIMGAIKHLKNEGIVKIGNYNKSAYDRTNWYAFDKNAVSILQKCKMEDAKKENGFDKNDEPIPDNIPNNIPDIKPYKESKKFTKPTIEEIQQYCTERNNGINAEAFYDFYESKNWYVGKNKMVDWKACVRTWERREKTTTKKTAQEKRFEMYRRLEEEYDNKRNE